MMFYQHSNKKSANEILFMTTFAQIFFKFGQFSTAEIRNSNVFNNQESKIKEVPKKSLKKLISLLVSECCCFNNP
jgi:hypothetical protein